MSITDLMELPYVNKLKMINRTSEIFVFEVEVGGEYRIEIEIPREQINDEKTLIRMECKIREFYIKKWQERIHG